MSKTADRVNMTQNGNPSTQQNTQTSNSAPQTQPTAPTSDSSDDLMQQMQSLSSDLDGMKKKFDTCAHAVIKLGGVVKDHDVAIIDLRNRVEALEACMKNCPTATPTVQTATSQPQAQTDNATPAAQADADKVSPVVVPGTGFTGKALVFFIHGKDGNLDGARPFYSPNVAKRYDWNYQIVPSWVENGRYVRPLTADEAANVVW